MTSSLLDARRGSQRPRELLIPEYSTTAASEVIDLAQTAGLVLDPWQRFVLEHGLGEQRDGRWAAASVGTWVPRQNGKGGIIEALELGWLFLLGERLILHSAHEYKTAQEAFLRIKGLIENRPDLDKRVNRYWQANGEQGIELTKAAGGARLRFVARSRTSGRGFSGDKNVLDEAQELTLQQMAALLPTLSARPNPQLWYFGTPPEDATAWCYALKDAADDRAPRFAWFNWGADIDITNPEDLHRLDDRDEWYASNPALGIRITEDFVEDERRTLQIKFAPERLGAWPVKAKLGSVAGIDADTWKSLGDPEAERPADVVFSIDVSPMRDMASISVAGMQEDGLVQVSTVEHKAGTGWIAARCAELKETWDPACFVLDSKGPANTLLEELAAVDIRPPDNEDYPQRGFLSLMTMTEVAQAFGKFVDAARQSRLKHRDDAPLNTALAGANTRPLGEGSAWARKAGDITALVAATNANWALETQAPRAPLGDVGVFFFD